MIDGPVRVWRAGLFVWAETIENTGLLTGG